MKSQEQIIKTARKKYQEAIRGREYQVQCIKKCETSGIDNFNNDEYQMLLRRKLIFISEIALLEDIFGTELLQNEIL